MSNDINSFYQEAITAEQSKEKAASRVSKDFLQCKPGNTYYVKIVPYFKSPKDTFINYKFHGWESLKTGQFVLTGRCWKEIGQKCPVCEAGYASYSKKETTNTGQPKSRLLLPKAYNLVNVYVISDPVNPENNGKVKVLRYGEVLAKKIRKAWKKDEGGEEDEFFGPAVFDFSKDGAVLKIKVGNKGDNANAPITYEESKFLTVRPGGTGFIDLSKEETKEICDGAFDLNSFLPEVKSHADVLSALDEHYHNKEIPASVTGRTNHQDDDEIPFGDLPPVAGKAAPLTDIAGAVDDFMKGIA